MDINPDFSIKFLNEPITKEEVTEAIHKLQNEIARSDDNSPLTTIQEPFFFQTLSILVQVISVSLYLTSKKKKEGGGGAINFIHLTTDQ